MGLLDDAIREHLELKRRHGADPSEVARQEREALGPTRHGPEPLELPPEAAPAGPEPPAPPPGAIHDERSDLRQDEPISAPVVDLEPEPLAEAPPVEPEPPATMPEEAEVEWDAPATRAEPEPADEVDQPTVAFDAADIADAQRRPAREPDGDPQREPGEERTRAADDDRPAGTAPREPDPPAGTQPTDETGSPAGTEPPPAPRESEGDEDVLEETPDFLQETPEHDRLWFEQRPPRDFDFDS